MKKNLVFLSLILLPFLSNSQIKEPKLKSISIDGINREYILHIPKDLPKNAPLVMVFHGYSGSAAGVHGYFNMNDLADKNGFAVVYPEGTIDQEGYHFWQTDYTSHKSLKVNDVSFVTKLADHLQKTYSLSKANSFIVGFSNGGDLCNKLICETNGIFKAAAPIISCMMLETYDKCQASKAVPVLMLNGTHDNITYWAGDVEDKQNYGGYHSTDTMLDFRVTQAGCKLQSTTTIESRKPDDKTSITLKKFSNTKTKNQVWMYQYNNGGHGHPDYLDLQSEVWSFFSLYLE